MLVQHYIYIVITLKGTVSKLRMADKSMFGEKQTKKATVGRKTEYRNDLTVIVTSAVVRSEELSGFIRPRYCAKSMATSGGTHL